MSKKRKEKTIKPWISQHLLIVLTLGLLFSKKTSCKICSAISCNTVWTISGKALHYCSLWCLLSLHRSFISQRSCFDQGLTESQRAEEGKWTSGSMPQCCFFFFLSSFLFFICIFDDFFSLLKTFLFTESLYAFCTPY